MLSHEWRELEVLCERVSDLRLRYTAALKTNNAGLVAGLKVDLARTMRLREQLVRHISASLGQAAAEGAGGARPDAGMDDNAPRSTADL
jgi:hypothetical protein